MRRRSYKYLFVFNCLLIAVIVIAAQVLDSNAKDEVKKVTPVSITTPLVNADVTETDFCESAKAAVLIDAKSGAVLYEKNAHTRLPMASTTKIMTALCIIENAETDDVITVTNQSANVEGSSVYLRAGEKITVLDLLYGLMLESGNDAASALAIGVFGSEKACVDKMNEKAHSLGLVSTSFENVHGLDSQNHYTTAYELSLIMKEAMKNDLFRKIVSTKAYTTCSENPRYFSNHNRLLHMTDYVIGGKTGYTGEAGRCLVSFSQKDGKEYVAVTLNDGDDWSDHKQMHCYGIDNFKTVEIVNRECVFRFGFDNYIACDDVYLTTRKDDELILDYKISVDIDNQICRATYFANGDVLGHFSLELQNVN